MYEDVKKQAVGTLKWAAFGQLLARAIQPTILILLARVLSPSEYGVLEIAILVVTLALILQDFGLSRALIQTSSDLRAASNIVFLSNIGFSVIIYSIIALGSPLLANIFEAQEAIPVLRIIGLQIVILAFSTVHMSLAQRELKYQRQFTAQLLGAIAMAVTVIVLVSLGYRIWSFVIASLVGSCVQTATYWITSPWRPSRIFDPQIARKLISFGILVAVEVFLGWLLNYGDNFVIGYFLGVESLGTYALAFNIAVFGLALLINPITSVSFASFSKLKKINSDIQRAFLNIVKVTAIIVIPSVFGLVLLADSIELVVLGGKWTGISPLIQILALSPGLTYLVVMNPEIYKAVGKPEIMPRLLLIVALYSLPTYVVGAQFGIVGFTLARFSVGVLFFPVHVFITARLLHLPFNYIWHASKTPLLAAFGMSAIVYTTLQLIPSSEGVMGWVNLGVLTMLGFATYSLFIFWLDRELARKIVALVRTTFSGS
jgi:PST family polysaccharide transporter